MTYYTTILALFTAILQRYIQSNLISGHLRDLYSLSANERCPLDRVKSKRKVLLTDKKTSEMSVRYSEVSAIEYVRKTVYATFLNDSDRSLKQIILKSVHNLFCIRILYFLAEPRHILIFYIEIS